MREEEAIEQGGGGTVSQEERDETADASELPHAAEGEDSEQEQQEAAGDGRVEMPSKGQTLSDVVYRRVGESVGGGG